MNDTKTNKNISILILVINIIGVIILFYYAIPYILHDTTVAHPDAMLPAEAWDRAGMMLTAGFLPLLAVNILGILFVKINRKYVRFLFLLPSVICLALVGSYWITAL